MPDQPSPTALTSSTPDSLRPASPQPGSAAERRFAVGGEKTILVAYVTVHLLSGESFQLLPFEHTDDVKAEVSKLIESWSQSGFLLRGRMMYPWHQVRIIEVSSVDELSLSQAAQDLIEWKIRDQYHALDDFWRTKKPQSTGNDKDNDKAEDSNEDTSGT